MRVSNSGRQTREPSDYKTSTKSINKRSEEGTFNDTKPKMREKPAPQKVEAPHKGTESTHSKKGTEHTASKKKPKQKESPKKEKPKKVVSAPKELKKLSGGRVFSMVLMGIVSSAILSLIVLATYKSEVMFPEKMFVEESSTGYYCLGTWEQTIKRLDDSIASFLEEDTSYLQQEVLYANDNKYKLDFLDKVIKTVSYTPKQKEATNKWGNPLIDENWNTVMESSNIKAGEEVTLSYVDYSKIELDRKEIVSLMQAHELSVGDVDYSRKLVDVFCDYISGIEKLPIKEDKRYTPNLVPRGNGYTVTKEEDIEIDKILFSSEEFHELLVDFSVVAGGSGAENPKWAEWNSLPEEQKAEQKEPEQTIDSLQPSEAWVAWDNLDKKDKEGQEEPEKYDSKLIMSKLWCGSYYLQNEYQEIDEYGNPVNVEISAMLGEGTLEDPAGLNTDVLTYVIYPPDEGSTEEYSLKPIKIRLTDFGVSKDAIDWFESKDVRNRGIDLDSEVQYCYCTFEITNMSDIPLVVPDNFSLCDVNANLHSRTGELFGLVGELSLEPDETATIETWGMSTSLNKQYVIWGKDFDRRVEPVWFRVLLGDLEDESEDKGVYLNKSRGIE